MQCQKLKTYMESGRVVFLPPKSIRANPAQPRQVFQEEGIAELADSIRQHGILQPLSVRRVGTGYELVAGERRLRAAKLAGLTEVPCIVMQMDDRESGFAALVENLQRQDLDFIEEAVGISRLMELGGMSQEQTARLLGKSQSAIANKLRLLRHSPPVLEALRRAGATFADEGAAECPGDPITKADLFALGLTGGTDSAAKRRALLKQLDLPEHLTPNGMLEALNLLYSREEFLSRMVKTQ